MIRITSRKNSLYFKLLILLVTSALISIIFFIVLNIGGNYLIDSYYYNSDHITVQNQKYISKLQKYVDENQVNIKDVTKLNNWVKKQGMISIEVYEDNILVYDSEHPEQDSIWEQNIELTDYDWNEYYSLQFVDAEGFVSIYGAYGYQIYNIATTIELCFSFILFLLLVLLGIRKKMQYILKLSEEIEILEGGNLNYPITVVGKDELGLLANGLDCMRKSFEEQVIQEAAMVQENQRIITEMSHDLRTPITSIMLYTEILKKRAYKDEKQLIDYLDKIDLKSRRMKQLVDNLFEYSLVTGESEVKLEEPEIYEVLFYDLFSETYNYLEQEGFHVKFRVEWINKKIQICMEYVTRIMDNITSNIIKYADITKTVTIFSVEEKNMAGFIFQNEKRNSLRKEESTGIGIQSIKNMMAKMNGKCIIKETQESFKIIVLFPIILK